MSRHHQGLDSRRWALARRRALDAARWRCQRCRRAGKLEVHHRTPIDEGGDAYAQENLEVLCRGCHIDHHRGDSRRPLTPAEARWQELVSELGGSA